MNELITEKNYPIEELWVLKSAIGSVVVLVIYLLFLFFGFFLRSNLQNSGIQNSGILGIYAIYVIAVTILHIIFVALRRVTFHYSLEDKFLTLQQGIISRQQRHIPYGVIQNISVQQRLLDRIFGLASLTIENASGGGGANMATQQQRRGGGEAVGFMGNKVNIPGLTKQNAEILKGFVLLKMKENPIEDNQSGL